MHIALVILTLMASSSPAWGDGLIGDILKGIHPDHFPSLRRVAGPRRGFVGGDDLEVRWAAGPGDKSIRDIQTPMGAGPGADFIEPISVGPRLVTLPDHTGARVSDTNASHIARAKTAIQPVFSAFPEVGIVVARGDAINGRSDTETAVCTATAVAPNAFVTAAHCICSNNKPAGLGGKILDGRSCQAFLETDKGHDFIANSGVSVLLPGTGVFFAERVIPHPSFDWTCLDKTDGECSLADILLIITKPIPTVTPLGISKGNVDSNRYFHGVGYGSLSLQLNQQAPVISITAGLKALTPYQPGEVARCNDNAADVACIAYVGSIIGKAWAALCGGDSGGPLVYLDEIGNAVVHAVASSAQPLTQGVWNCAADAVAVNSRFTLLAPHADWIETELAAAEPAADIPPPPTQPTCFEQRLVHTQSGIEVQIDTLGAMGPIALTATIISTDGNNPSQAWKLDDTLKDTCATIGQRHLSCIIPDDHRNPDLSLVAAGAAYIQIIACASSWEPSVYVQFEQGDTP